MKTRDYRYLGAMAAESSGTHQLSIRVAVILGFVFANTPFLFAEGMLFSYLMHPMPDAEKVFIQYFPIYCFIGFFALFNAVFCLTSLININNMISFSAYQHRSFWGMLKALGVRKREIRHIFFHEIFHVLLQDAKKLLFISAGKSLFQTALWNIMMSLTFGKKGQENIPAYLMLRISFLAVPTSFLTVLFLLFLWVSVSSYLISFSIVHTKERKLLEGAPL